MLKLKTSNGKWESFCERIEHFLSQDLITQRIDEKQVKGYRSPDSPALWIRDHSDIMRGGIYFEKDITSAVDCFADQQARNGRLFDYVLTSALRESTERENWEKWVRVQVEADVEYRFIKAAFLSWQATGNEEWLRSILPALESAFRYTTTHPSRWDTTNQLVKRPYTIDTWDFDYTAGREPWLNFKITDDTFWGIAHCDNSGIYESASLLATIHTELGNRSASQTYLDFASALKERANKLLFNGRFYTHFHKLTPVEITEINEAEQLSLSTPMAINRGLATPEIAKAILLEYQKRRAETDAFAEWFGVDPAFPAGCFGDEKIVEGAYINGGVFPLVGGEIACAAFENGFEKYGLNTLEQYNGMIAEKGETYLWYFHDGTASSVATSTSPDAMPTDGWGSSSMLNGFIRGLCGISDLSHSFQRVQCTPRWAVTDESSAEIQISYAHSNAAFGYSFEHNRDSKVLHFTLKEVGTEVDFSALLPTGSTAAEVFINSSKTTCNLQQKGESSYVCLQQKLKRADKIEIHYS